MMTPEMQQSSRKYMKVYKKGKERISTERTRSNKMKEKGKCGVADSPSPPPFPHRNPHSLREEPPHKGDKFTSRKTETGRLGFPFFLFFPDF